MFDELIRGLMVGLAVSIPVGPIALLIMRRALIDGRRAGIFSGLGAATADLVCGTVIAVGLTAITKAVELHPDLMRFIGGVLMLGMGLHTLFSKISGEAKRPVHERNLAIAYFSTAALTLANPMTFMGLTFVGAAAGIGGRELSPIMTGILVAGISLGSAAWWLLLSCSAAWLGRKLGNRTLEVINISAGALIIAFGLFQLAMLVPAIRH